MEKKFDHFSNLFSSLVPSMLVVEAGKTVWIWGFKRANIEDGFPNFLTSGYAAYKSVDIFLYDWGNIPSGKLRTRRRFSWFRISAQNGHP